MRGSARQRGLPSLNAGDHQLADAGNAGHRVHAGDAAQVQLEVVDRG